MSLSYVTRAVAEDISHCHADVLGPSNPKVALLFSQLLVSPLHPTAISYDFRFILDESHYSGANQFSNRIHKSNL